jgi:hypothetical protein
MEKNNRQNVIVLWFAWQFYEMPRFLFEVWNNYFLFALNYFSLPVLLKSLFAPWRKYKWNYPKGFNLGEFFSTLISNSFSRIIGAMMRVVLIFVGILFQVSVILIGLIIFVLWILVPFIIIGLIFTFYV